MFCVDSESFFFFFFQKCVISCPRPHFSGDEEKKNSLVREMGDEDLALFWLSRDQDVMSPRLEPTLSDDDVMSTRLDPPLSDDDETSLPFTFAHTSFCDSGDIVVEESTRDDDVCPIALTQEDVNENTYTMEQKEQTRVLQMEDYIPTPSPQQSSVSRIRQTSSTTTPRTRDKNRTSKPTSMRMQFIAANSIVNSQFSTILPFLKECLPLKNDDGLFDAVQYLIDDCIVYFCKSFHFVTICLDMMSWEQMLRIASLHRFVWTRLRISLSQNQPPRVRDVYVDRQIQRMWIVEFVHAVEDFDVRHETDEIDILRTALCIPTDVRIEYLRLPVLSVSQESKHCSDDALRKKSSTKSSLLCKRTNSEKNQAKRTRDIVSKTCECKIWSLLLLFFVNGQCKSPDACYFDHFMPDPDFCSVLMNISMQSLLYFCAEHDFLLESWIARATQTTTSATNEMFRTKPTTKPTAADRRMRGQSVTCTVLETTLLSNDFCSKFTTKLFAQTNQKSLLAVRKESANKVGKFKGRQRDQLLCITVNGTLGVQVTFDRLFSTSLFALLIQAQKLPVQSGINYHNLVTHLPFIFPQNFECLFGSEFFIKTPFMQTSDPECVFGPIATMLWPDLPNVEALVKHLKTYKLDFEIGETTTAQTPPPQQQQSSSHAARFVRALELGPNQPFVDFTNWVSIVDEQQQPLGIYYSQQPGQSIDLHTAAVHIARHNETASGDISQQQLYQMTPPAAQTSGLFMPTMTKIVFIQNKQQQQQPLLPSMTQALTWKGSRERGFAVRRVFKNGHVMVNVFKSLSDFERRERPNREDAPKVKLSERMFAVLDVTVALQDICNVKTTGELMSIEALHAMFKNTNFESTLVLVDDIGKPRYYSLGNVPRTQSPQYKCCKECQLLPPEDNDDKTMMPSEDDINIRWFTALQAASIAQPIRELESSQSLNYPFVMSHNGLSPKVRSISMSSSNLTLRQHTDIVLPRATANFRYAHVGAIHNPRIKYVNTYKKLVDILIQRVLGITVAQKCELVVPSHDTTHFKAVVPRRNCSCCANTTLPCCQSHIANVLLLMDLLDPVDSISTTILPFQGRAIQSEIITADCGLRCTHDWTKGSGDVFFRATFATQTTVCAMFQSNADTKRTNVLVVDQQHMNHNVVDSCSRLLVVTTHP